MRAFPAARVLNSADPDAPNGVNIARTIAKRSTWNGKRFCSSGPPIGNVGRHAWDRYPPVVLDTSAAHALGYTPVGNYAATVGEEIDWLVRPQQAPPVQ